ncbi:hypothetical protein NDU88_006429 [Pleurodeles waltl]|uniref:Uncharacterized protein n=1 Tax=Pleurodeles waltl TaxID=8319 RepID=A0AAV7SPJ6_PLEWA|nr:hypothetical protein NDU88_006429 [Pleurodeles waltl]
MQGLRAASNCSPVHGRDPGPGPAPCVLLGPPASSDTASVRLSRARSPLGPEAPAAPPPPPVSPLGASRCSVPSAHSPPRFAAPRKAAASAACSGPQTLKSQTGRFRHSRSCRGGPHTLGPLRCLDLNRPGEGSLPTFYSSAPPELTIQACTIFRSLATPPTLL